MYIPIMFVVFAIILFYLTYRFLKAEKDVLLEIIRYIFAAVFVSFAILLIITALKCADPMVGI